VARVAPSQATVLLLGESGTGKELVAQAVHETSPRAHRALVVVDCSSLPETLFESELFGHERGAFTGANTAQAGLVEAASGGTLFLDEVGDIPLPMQVKLLRLLESGTYRRVGSTELRHPTSAWCRPRTATWTMVADGRFREDLYYRLSTFPIDLPALRERRDDIPVLASALLERVAAPRRLAITPAAMDLLQAQPFPGNVRELRNLGTRRAAVRRRHAGPGPRAAGAGQRTGTAPGPCGRSRRRAGRTTGNGGGIASALANRGPTRRPAIPRTSRPAGARGPPPRQPRHPGRRAGHQRAHAIPQTEGGGGRLMRGRHRAG
jgi:transcriptional regulator with GAF, ATPase, and Fis domain